MRLLDFLADHVDFDYTLTQMHRSARISRPTLYRLVADLEKEGLLVTTREVGGSRFYRLATENPRVVAMLQLDFQQINADLVREGLGGVERRGPKTSAAPSPRRAATRTKSRPVPR